ncbi:general secretion pathway protein L [Bordetella ansorpii]|uniref:General secretion pathway protein L n=1 Tax=Bordetella ansorpii TaxID=288768 RepID=A0A157Q104_9BORD|nr:type II secretion system protein GspL [Bordetella ansorpii]SAI39555.1 general secretion pathway protein L [Bordetella ansorpii]
MKNILRIALPPLADLTATSLLDYAWFDRRGQRARHGTLAPAGLAGAFPNIPVQAVLHPHDAILASVQVPAVAAARFDAAVNGALEALVLSDLSTLAVGHGPRAADGAVAVAWADSAALQRAWMLLSQAGLQVRALVPVQVLAGDAADADAALGSHEDPRWNHDAPSWSLALPHLAPQRPSRWKPALRWAAVAAVLWIVGLNFYASQLRGEATRLRETMVSQVRDTFPGTPVVLDAVRQAEQGYNALLAGNGAGSAGDFMTLARGAAQVLPFAADNVDKLTYKDQALLLELAPAKDGNDDRVGDVPAIMAKATALGLRIEREENAPHWRILQAQP